MDKKEILEKASEKKAVVGEVEAKGISKSAIIALIFAGAMAISFIVTEGCLGHFSASYAIASICFLWAGVFYALQFFVAKRHYAGILIGASLEGLAGLFFLIRYILLVTGVWA